MEEDLLSAYLDGELDASTRAAVDARLTESHEWRDILDEVRAARDAVRALPTHEAPAGFWERVLGTPPDTATRDDAAPVVVLEEQRPARRLRTRWAALAGVAAAAVVLAVSVVPSRDETRPPVATFTNAHAARSSLSDDAVSQLAGIGRNAGLR